VICGRCAEGVTATSIAPMPRGGSKTFEPQRRSSSRRAKLASGGIVKLGALVAGSFDSSVRRGVVELLDVLQRDLGRLTLAGGSGSIALPPRRRVVLRSIEPCFDQQRLEDAVVDDSVGVASFAATTD
jgi:hypothetical protein